MFRPRPETKAEDAGYEVREGDVRRIRTKRLPYLKRKECLRDIMFNECMMSSARLGDSKNDKTQRIVIQDCVQWSVRIVVVENNEGEPVIHNEPETIAEDDLNNMLMDEATEGDLVETEVVEVV